MANGNFGGGSGTAIAPFLIEDGADLIAISKNSTSLSKHYALKNDIDLNVSPYNEGKGYPVESLNQSSFTASLDGRGFTISNLMINIEDIVYDIGIIRSGNGAVIKNINMENVNIYAPNSIEVGSILGKNAYVSASEKISNISVNGKIVGKKSVGGVIGQVTCANSSFTSVYTDIKSSVEIEGSEYLGGIFGRIYNNKSASQIINNTVERCLFTGNIVVSTAESNSNYIGAFVGRIEDSPNNNPRGLGVTDSYYDIDLFPNNNNLGGNSTSFLQEPMNYNAYLNITNIKGEVTWIIDKGKYPRLWTEKLPANKSLILHDGEYKKWNEKVDDIPFGEIITKQLTSNGTDVQSSSEINNAYRAFDRDVRSNVNGWSEIKATSNWLQYSFEDAVLIKKYSIYPQSNLGAGGYVNRSPKDWKLLGSNNGVDFVTLDTRSNITSWVEGVANTFEINATVAYKIYRILITENNGGTYVSVGELELYSYPIQGTPASFVKVELANIAVDGMDSLSPLLDRKITTLEPQPMTSRDDILQVGEEGKVFSKTIDLKKYFDIRSGKVEVR